MQRGDTIRVTGRRGRFTLIGASGDTGWWVRDTDHRMHAFPTGRIRVVKR